VKITLGTYCHTEVSDFRKPLRAVAAQLLLDVMKSTLQPKACIDLKEMEPMSGVEPLTY
jgi:hypothetical protein